MPIERYTDDRLDDIVLELRALRAVPQTVAEHGVHIVNHGVALTHLDATLERLDAKLDANTAAFRITPGMRLAAAVPILSSLIACVGVIIVSGKPA